ncbi:MAG TPA: glycosyltransferase [Kofleriaceae bacterium]|nr:glycosyltransferase [Kofleriaceae bacterium]
MSRIDGAVPRVSVVVRSFNRLSTLSELLAALLDQDHDSFEIVVVEQSTLRPPADVARVEQLARDPRVRLLRHEPLGGPRARNVGVCASRGGVIVFIDDDDLPATRDWLRRHEANFSDPRCLGATGRHLLEGADAATPPYKNMEKARRQVLSFNLLKWQRVWVCSDRRTEVESLHGTNSAIRRSTVERFGLWDECTPIEDEPSIAYRINAGKRPDEYLVFDPEPRIIRRLDEPGGMGKRSLSAPAYAQRVFTFLHNIVGHYFPVRFALLYPLYVVLTAHRATDWILTFSRKHATPSQRALAITGLYTTLPVLWIGWLLSSWAQRIRHGEPARHPWLSPGLLADPSPPAMVAPTRVAAGSD